MAEKKVVPCPRLKKLMVKYPEINRGVKKKLKNNPASVQRLNEILESNKSTKEIVAAVNAMMAEETVKKKDIHFEEGDVLFLGGTHPDTGVITGFTVGLSTSVGFEIAMHGPDLPVVKEVIWDLLKTLEARAVALEDKEALIHEARESLLENDFPMRIVESTVERSLLVYKPLWGETMDLAMDLPVIDFFFVTNLTDDTPSLQ